MSIRGKTEYGKSIILLGHLDGETFQVFFDKFTRNGELTEEVRDFSKVKYVLLERFGKK